MLASHIESQIYKNFSFTPTDEQKKIIFSLCEYLLSERVGEAFILNGYAGTGKTTIIAALVNTLKEMGVKSVLMAPTGRAAKVMGLYSGERAFTIHRKIYKQRSSGDMFSRFELNFNKSNDTVFIVDEASMISDTSYDSAFGSGSLLGDMFEYIETGQRNKVIVVGDSAQLPPVGLAVSPAMDIESMRLYCSPDYHTLTEVVRQGLDSGVLFNATRVRKLIEEQEADYADLLLHLTKDVIKLPGDELIDALETSYSNFGKEGTAIITRSNKRANRFNQGVRRMVLGHEEELESADVLMVVKNSYYMPEADKDTPFDFIANGDMVVIRKIYKTVEQYGFRFAYALLSLPDYDDYQIERWIILDTLYTDAPSLTREQQEQLFREVEKDYADIPIKKKRTKAVLEDEKFSALQVKFGYAFTCHKAQGGQWHDVYIDTLFFGEEQLNTEFARWLYTAITRATGRVYFVGWDDKFFDNLPQE